MIMVPPSTSAGSFVFGCSYNNEVHLPNTVMSNRVPITHTHTFYLLVVAVELAQGLLLLLPRTALLRVDAVHRAHRTPAAPLADGRVKAAIHLASFWVVLPCRPSCRCPKMKYRPCEAKVALPPSPSCWPCEAMVAWPPFLPNSTAGATNWSSNMARLVYF